MTKPRTQVVIFDRGVASNPYSVGLARGLSACGTSVTIAGPPHYEPRPGDPEVVPVYPRGGVHGRKVQKGMEALAGLLRTLQIAVVTRPQVVHFQWGAPYDRLLARVFRLLPATGIVYTAHNPDRDDQRQMIVAADHVIVHGPALRDALLRCYPSARGKVSVIPHGNFEHALVRYDRARARRELRLSPDGPVFTYLGQLLPRKGVEILAEAFARHCRDGLPGSLVVAGPSYGVEVDALRRVLGEFDARALWLTSNEDVPSRLIDLAVSAATMVALPFLEATQSGSVIYAMTHGRCVVSTTLGEIPGTLTDRGLLVPPGDVDRLADALRLGVVDPSLCDELGARARRYAVEQLDWAPIARMTTQVYRRVVMPKGDVVGVRA